MHVESGATIVLTKKYISFGFKFDEICWLEHCVSSLRNYALDYALIWIGQSAMEMNLYQWNKHIHCGLCTCMSDNSSMLY